MQTHPYSIYLDNRPFRIAFLIDPVKGADWLDKIFEFNKEKWGGRHNPIITTSGEEISADWWAFLRSYDPDIIYSTVKLSDNLQKKIQVFLSPLMVENVDGSAKHIGLPHYDPISVLPTYKNVFAVTWGLMNPGVHLALFELDKSAPLEIQKFIKRSFGAYETGQSLLYHLKKSLEECPVKRYPIKDYDSLNSALLDLGEFSNNIVFPIQLCSIPNVIKDVEYNYPNEQFSIIVGDSSDDLISFWNHSICTPHWLRKFFTHMWVPSEVMDNQTVKPGLEKFINRFTSQTGNSNNQGARFISHSVNKTTLDSYVARFTHIWHPKTTQALTSPELPKFSNNERFFLKQGLKSIWAHSNEEHLVIDEPDIQEGVMGEQHWFIDLYIQFRPERFTNIIGLDYWWQLPKRNNILLDTKFVNKPARVNEDGIISILMQRQSSIRRNENKLVIKIPDDRSIFASLICGTSYDCYSRDDRERFKSRPFDQMRRSDKGMYLTGVLSLFPDLLNAHGIFEERYWRKIFKMMANQSDQKDQRLKTYVMNKLIKNIDKGRDFKNSQEDQEWLTEQIINLSRQNAKQENDLTFKQMLDEAEEEASQYNEEQKNDNNFTLNPEGLREEISSMLALNVFLLGLKPQCPKCGYRIWYPISEISQTITCKGCNNVFPLDAEEVWHYRLNSLLRAGVSDHGLTPVLLVLGQLMHDARSSFMYFPSCELFTKSRSTQEPSLFGELDLLCIKDGEFIIGEIKQSTNGFTQTGFDKIEKIAKLIRPDKVLFSSMDNKPNAFVSKGITQITQSLEELEVKAEWYSLNEWAFKPSTIR